MDLDIRFREVDLHCWLWLRFMSPEPGERNYVDGIFDSQ